MKKLAIMLAILGLILSCVTAPQRTSQDFASTRAEELNAVKRGDFDHARKLCQELIVIAKSQFGSNSPQTLQAYLDLGNVYCLIQDWKSARDAYVKSLRIAEGLSLRDHRMGYLQYKIGYIYMNDRKEDTARPFLEQALQTELALGDDKDALTLADTLYYLGRYYRHAGDGTKSVDMLEQSQLYYEQIVASGAPPWSKQLDLNYADVLGNLGEVYIEAEAYAKGLDILEKASEIFVRNIGEDDPRVVRAFANIGVCAYYLGNLDRAIIETEKALSIILRHRALFDPANRKFYNSLAVFYTEKGDAEKAAEYRLKAAMAGQK